MPAPPLGTVLTVGLVAVAVVGAIAALVDLLVSEEHEVSDARSDVLQVLDALQEELKRRYRDDPSLVLS